MPCDPSATLFSLQQASTLAHRLQISSKFCWILQSFTHIAENGLYREKEKKKVPISLKEVRTVNFIQVGGKVHSA